MSIRRTKIVATVGPACQNVDTLAAMIQAGGNVFRLNMAHGDIQTHTFMVEQIRQAAEQARRPIGLLADLAGPKIRVTRLKKPIKIEKGQKFALVGPTGSGKSTTLYAGMRELISSRALHVVTVEDPVAYEMDGMFRQPH